MQRRNQTENLQGFAEAVKVWVPQEGFGRQCRNVPRQAEDLVKFRSFDLCLFCLSGLACWHLPKSILDRKARANGYKGPQRLAPWPGTEKNSKWRGNLLLLRALRRTTAPSGVLVGGSFDLKRRRGFAIRRLQVAQLRNLRMEVRQRKVGTSFRHDRM